MNNKEKAFIILSPGFPASEADTSCLPLQQALVRTVSKLYPSIKIIVLSFQYPFHNLTYQWRDATVLSFNGRNRRGLSKLLIRRKVNKVLEQINREKQIIGLLSFWLGECALVGKRFSHKHHLIHYCWLLGQDAKANNKYVKRVRVKGNELIALSDFLQHEFERNYGIKPFVVIPPGLEERPYYEVQRDIDLLAVGSLIPLKQFEAFIEIVAAVKKHLPEVIAVLIGDGPERNKLKDLIAGLNLEKNIILKGELPHEEVLEWMQRSKILLHPSSYEGFGMVCLEALNAGMHVTSFHKVMNKEIEKWHLVRNKNEMKQKTLELISGKLEHKKIAPFPIQGTVQKLMQLFAISSIVKKPYLLSSEE